MRIPPDLRPEIKRRAGSGEGSTQIARWLAAEHGIKVSDRAVRNLLAAERAERADVAKVVVREQLQKQLPADLDELEGVRERLRQLERGALEGEKKEPMLALRALEAQARVLDLKLHYSGAGEPDAPAAASVGVVVLPPLDE